MKVDVASYTSQTFCLFSDPCRPRSRATPSRGFRGRANLEIDGNLAAKNFFWSLYKNLTPYQASEKHVSIKITSFQFHFTRMYTAAEAGLIIIHYQLANLFCSLFRNKSEFALLRCGGDIGQNFATFNVFIVSWEASIIIQRRGRAFR